MVGARGRFFGGLPVVLNQPPLRLAVGAALMVLALSAVLEATLRDTHQWVRGSDTTFALNPATASGEGAVGAMADALPRLDALAAALEGEGALVYAHVRRHGRHATSDAFVGTAPLVEAYVTPAFFRARGLDVSHGRLLIEGVEDEVLVGAALARDLFGSPASAVGADVAVQNIERGVTVQHLRVVGVLQTSPYRDPRLDVDWHIVADLSAQVAREPIAVGGMPPALFISFPKDAPPAVLDDVQGAVQSTLGNGIEVLPINEAEIGRWREAGAATAGARVMLRTGVLASAAIATALALVAAALQLRPVAERLALQDLEMAYGSDGVAASSRALRHAVAPGLGGMITGAIVSAALLQIRDGRVLEQSATAIAAAAGLTAAVLVASWLVARSIVQRTWKRRLHSEWADESVQPHVTILLLPALVLSLSAAVAAGHALALSAGLMSDFAQSIERAILVTATPLQTEYRPRREFVPRWSASTLTDMDLVAIGALPSVQAVEPANFIADARIEGPDGRALLGTVASYGRHFADLVGGLPSEEGVCRVTADVAERLHLSAGAVITLVSSHRDVTCRIDEIVAPLPLHWLTAFGLLPHVTAPRGAAAHLLPIEAVEGRHSSVLVILHQGASAAELLGWLRANGNADALAAIPLAGTLRSTLERLMLDVVVLVLLSCLSGTLVASSYLRSAASWRRGRRPALTLLRVYGASRLQVLRASGLHSTSVSLAAMLFGVVTGYWVGPVIFGVTAHNIGFYTDERWLPLVLLAAVGAAIVIGIAAVSARPPYAKSRSRGNLHQPDE